MKRIWVADKINLHTRMFAWASTREHIHTRERAREHTYTHTHYIRTFDLQHVYVRGIGSHNV